MQLVGQLLDLFDGFLAVPAPEFPDDEDDPTGCGDDGTDAGEYRFPVHPTPSPTRPVDSARVRSTLILAVSVSTHASSDHRSKCRAKLRLSIDLMSKNRPGAWGKISPASPSATSRSCSGRVSSVRMAASVSARVLTRNSCSRSTSR